MHQDPLPTLDRLAASVLEEAGDDRAGRLVRAIETGRELTELGDGLVERFVDDARAGGLSWSEIGALFGTSKQAAQKRYGATTGAWPGLAPAAQQAMNRAGRDAHHLGHTHVGTEHALLGLLATDAGMAADALRELGLEREAVLAGLGPSEGPLRHDCVGVRPRLKRALEGAGRIAANLGHRPADTEHVLAALVADGDALATEIIGALGVTPEDVRRVLARRLDVDASQLVVRRRRRRLGRALA